LKQENDMASKTLYFAALILGVADAGVIATLNPAGAPTHAARAAVEFLRPLAPQSADSNPQAVAVGWAESRHSTSTPAG
jgi:hypothetical protein